MEKQPGEELFSFSMSERDFTVRYIKPNTSEGAKTIFRVFEGEIPHVFLQTRIMQSVHGMSAHILESRNQQRGVYKDAKSPDYQSRIVRRLAREIVTHHILGIQAWYSDNERSADADFMYGELKNDPQLDVQEPNEMNGYRYVVTAV